MAQTQLTRPHGASSLLPSALANASILLETQRSRRGYACNMASARFVGKGNSSRSGWGGKPSFAAGANEGVRLPTANILSEIFVSTFWEARRAELGR